MYTYTILISQACFVLVVEWRRDDGCCITVNKVNISNDDLASLQSAGWSINTWEEDPASFDQEPSDDSESDIRAFETSKQSDGDELLAVVI